ncbi:MAG: hypothetical protein ACYC3L_01375 [Gemmatimonadaceae bacterium]
MTAPATYSVTSRNSDKRTPVEYMLVTDQHGREWEGEFDLRTLTWVGPLHLRIADPPVDIPLKYVEPVKGPNGRNVAGRVIVREERWLKDTLERLVEWRQDMTLRAKAMYPSNYGEMLKNPSRDLLVEVGPGPIHPDFIRAMMAGNKWALGLTNKKPSWVTDAMLEGAAALKRAFGWRETVGELGEIDPSLFPDADDEDELPETDDETEAEAVPVRRGPGRPRKGA